MPDSVAIPAGPAQQGVWLTERLGAARTSYHLPVRISFDRVDPVALRTACAGVTARHPALRSCLTEREGILALVPCAAEPTMTESTAADSPAALTKLLEEESARPFALEHGPLVRFTLFHGPAGSAELLVVAHHAVFDGMSKDLLVADLAAAYNAALTGSDTDARLGTPARPAHLPVPDAALVKAAADWFAPRWADPADLVLPGVRRAVLGAGAGQALTRRLDRAALAAAAQACQVTTFEFVLTAVHALLRRYGNPNAPVSLALSTRTPELAGEIGLFVNELPHHAPAAGAAPSFAEFAAAVRTELRELYRFRTVPFGAAAGGLSPRVGLTPVSFSYRRRGAEPQFTGSTTRVDWMVFNGTARNTLHLQAVESAEECELSLQFDPSVLSPEAAERIADHLGNLLAAAAATPTLALDALPLLGEEEFRLVTEAWNDTARAYPADRTVLDLFDAHAAGQPDAVAVTAVDTSLTYRQLHQQSVDLAHRLVAAGVRPGSLVGLHLRRSSRLPVALLAVLRAGAAYLPLDPGYPAERLALVLADSGAALLLADLDPAAEVAAAAPTVLRLDQPAEPVAGTAAPVPAEHEAAPPLTEPLTGTAAPLPVATPADRAYVLYTSGSTGRPKGVAVGHRALVNLLSSFADQLDCGPEDGWLGLTSLSFDIAGLELFLPLVTGARLVLVGDGLALDGPALTELLRRERVSHVQATPSGWRVLLSGDGLPPGLTALVGGEALPLPLARELRARVARLFNVYGPTETTIWSTCAELPVAPERIRIGRPIANTRAYVLDPLHRPLPVGVPGELYLGGDGVAEGYLDRPELTAERFVTDPYAGGRMYRTGDLAAWTEDGELDFLGRLDHQVKIRGHRIELGEIESALLEHPAVAEAAVAVDQDAAGEPRLVGYLVAAAAVPGPAELRAHLSRTLPGAMVPQLFLVLPAMPLTPNGKLDRRALPAAPATVAEPVAIRHGAGAGDPVEAELCAICSEVLGLPDIGVDEDLFDLGAHSLSFIQIAARIRKSFDVDLDLDVFFETPTVAELAEAVKESQ
ncbi:non-ribosomal peptide synthetase [Streptomyces tateyamensis]|uniref:Non-ribosomal peptide synthetase n=1 Tax=Streptomyces tateyamensis TaxID=565073 RepID=A0A2V4MZN6_9ACTN|nr:amino acid adenylation domain-containing protein [Streptomyces tateyamensis]PYC71876.1 non-ribosomal peptide synthetase [Streptomyces tateyamensis]